MPNLEGYCSECREYRELDYFLYYRGERYDFCSLKCLYDMVCRANGGEL